MLNAQKRLLFIDSLFLYHIAIFENISKFYCIPIPLFDTNYQAGILNRVIEIYFKKT